MHRIQKFVRMPASGERSSFCFAVADDARYDQVGIVKSRAVGMRQRIAKLAAFVDGSRSFRRHMTRDPTRKGELREEASETGLILRDIGVDLAVGALEVRIGNDARTTVSGAGDIDHAQIVFLDDPVQVHVDEIESGCRAPMAEQTRLDVM